jgi:hypothetical protein
VLAVQPYNASERATFLLLGALAIWFAIRGMRTGTVPLKFTTLKRSDGAPLFWFGIGMNFFMGIMLLLGFLFGTDILK